MKIGDKIRVIANTNNNNYVVGNIYKIVDFIDNYVVAADKNNITGNHLRISDIEKINDDINYLKNKKEEIELNKILNEKKLEFLEKTRKEELIESEFIAWYMLNIFNSNDKDKQLKLTNIINSMTNKPNINILKAH